MAFESTPGRGSRSYAGSHREMRGALDALCAPFAQSEVRWRVGARSEDKKRGQALPYLEARSIQARLDAVIGPQNWAISFESIPDGVRCQLALHCNGEWVAKVAVASTRPGRAIAANGGTTDAEGTHDAAFVRAAAVWGIGRYLQELEAPWVDLQNETQFAQLPELPDYLVPSAGAQDAAGNDSSLQRGQAVTTQVGPSDAIATSDLVSTISKSVAQANTTVDAQTSLPSSAPIGTEEQWAALTDPQRTTAGVLLERIQKGLALHSLEGYLTTGNGKNLPDWLRVALHRKLAARVSVGAAGKAILEAAAA